MSSIVVFSTCSNKREAKRLTQSLLDKKLIACAAVIDRIESRFWWKGKIDSARESMLVLKTRKNLLKKVAKEIKRFHSYEVPEVIALPIVGGNRDYLTWIEESCRKK